jgi:hypothetical protein
LSLRTNQPAMQDYTVEVITTQLMHLNCLEQENTIRLKKFQN